ncbi:ribonuclease T2 [Trifolium repens]|nr:ribonuclease T2 [Trifolium repens]
MLLFFNGGLDTAGPPSNCQRLIVRDNFTIHGLWPSNYSDPQSKACLKHNDKGALFNLAQFPKELTNNLRKS